VREHGRGKNWIRKQIAAACPKTAHIPRKDVIVVADATYFGRSHGVLVFRDPHSRRNILFREIRSETASVYESMRKELEGLGFIIKAVALDGRKGIRELFAGIPVQMCHFHQKRIITRYLTRNPRCEASKELKAIVKPLGEHDHDSFGEALKEWHERWGNYLSERTINHETKRWHYTHRKLRAAYRSLVTNLPFLFTYKKHPELKIPNTTNSLEGTFSHLKGLIEIHRGMKKHLKTKMLVEILGNPNPKKRH